MFVEICQTGGGQGRLLDWTLAVGFALMVVLVPTAALHGMEAVRFRLGRATQSRVHSIGPSTLLRIEGIAVLVLLGTIGMRALLGRPPDYLIVFYGPLLYVTVLAAILYWRHPSLLPFVSDTDGQTPFMSAVGKGFGYFSAAAATVGSVLVALVLMFGTAPR